MFKIYFFQKPLIYAVNHQKDKFAYTPLDSVADYIYIADLILDFVLAEKRYLTKSLN